MVGKPRSCDCLNNLPFKIIFDKHVNNGEAFRTASSAIMGLGQFLMVVLSRSLNSVICEWMTFNGSPGKPQILVIAHTE